MNIFQYFQIDYPGNVYLSKMEEFVVFGHFLMGKVYPIFEKYLSLRTSIVVKSSYQLR